MCCCEQGLLLSHPTRVTCVHWMPSVFFFIYASIAVVKQHITSRAFLSATLSTAQVRASISTQLFSALHNLAHPCSSTTPVLRNEHTSTSTPSKQQRHQKTGYHQPCKARPMQLWSSWLALHGLMYARHCYRISRLCQQHWKVLRYVAYHGVYSPSAVNYYICPNILHCIIIIICDLISQRMMPSQHCTKQYSATSAHCSMPDVQMSLLVSLPNAMPPSCRFLAHVHQHHSQQDE